MGSAISSSSSPEPDDTSADRIMAILAERPLRMTSMLRLTRMISESSPEEKLRLHRMGVVRRLCDTIAEYGGLNTNQQVQNKNPSKFVRRSRQKQTLLSTDQRGIGYGHGSTRSHWDISRTVEERLSREEHLTWLLNAMTAFIYCSNPDFSNTDHLIFMEHHPVHLNASVAKEIGESAIIPLLEYHLNNDSIFDVSEHLELYHALLETAAATSMVPALLPYLVKPLRSSRSIVKDLVIRFCTAMITYPNLFKWQLGSPDFRLIDFINKTQIYAKVLINAANRYENELSTDQQQQQQQQARTGCHPCRLSLLNDDDASEQFLRQLDNFNGNPLTDIYPKMLKNYQIQLYRFIGDYGKLEVPFAFKKDVRNVNPFSASLRERTKRIAKELASMASSLPMNASNSIFVCVDEGRCDIVKVLISGPDGTPYQNGLFEFDVFFPASYPFSPPKLAFLTTGSGNVRFNPNLYNDGKICLSILGTWEGRPEEKWSPFCSILQVLVSIQGLIFVKEPYYNEPGFEKYHGTERGEECSKRYNLQIEHATLTYAIRDQFKNPPNYFRKVIRRHFYLKRDSVIEQANEWIKQMRHLSGILEKHSKKDELLELLNDSIAQICELKLEEGVVQSGLVSFQCRKTLCPLYIKAENLLRTTTV